MIGRHGRALDVVVLRADMSDDGVASLVDNQVASPAVVSLNGAHHFF